MSTMHCWRGVNSVYPPHYHPYVDKACRNQFSSYKDVAEISPFGRRTECVVWHPDCNNLFASCHGGDIVLIPDTQSPDTSSNYSYQVLRRGIGKGGSVTHMIMSNDSTRLLFTSHDGRFSAMDILTGAEAEIANTHDQDHWYTSVAQSNHTSCLAVTDNKGNLHMFDTRTSAAIGSCSIHRSAKISCVDFNSLGVLLASASNDKSCRIFDLRFLCEPRPFSGRPEICIFPHNGVVSSCYFAPYGGSSLLTTAQNDEIRVYNVSLAGELDPPLFRMTHPHKFYQHISIIKAVWHPQYRHVACIGRYSDKRGLDFIDTRGEMIWNVPSGRCETILCVNAFSPDGSMLASGTSSNVLIWKKNLCPSFVSRYSTHAERDDDSPITCRQNTALSNPSPSTTVSSTTMNDTTSNHRPIVPSTLDFSHFSCS